MLLTPHALTGMVIAKYEPELWPAALAAVVVHLILDAIPHTDMVGSAHINKGNILLRTLDTFVLLAIFQILIPNSSRLYTAIIIFFAILPDLIEIPGLIWPAWRTIPGIKQFHHWHTAVLQYSWPKVGWALGLLPQLILVWVCIYYLAT